MKSLQTIECQDIFKLLTSRAFKEVHTAVFLCYLRVHRKRALSSNCSLRLRRTEVGLCKSSHVDQSRFPIYQLRLRTVESKVGDFNHFKFGRTGSAENYVNLLITEENTPWPNFSNLKRSMAVRHCRPMIIIKSSIAICVR